MHNYHIYTYQYNDEFFSKFDKTVMQCPIEYLSTYRKIISIHGNRNIIYKNYSPGISILSKIMCRLYYCIIRSNIVFCVNTDITMHNQTKQRTINIRITKYQPEKTYIDKNISQLLDYDNFV